jgi:hypothetical protein
MAPPPEASIAEIDLNRAVDNPARVSQQVILRGIHLG